MPRTHLAGEEVTPERPRISRPARFSSFREDRIWSTVRASNSTNVYLENLEVQQEWIPFEPSPLDKNVTQKQCGLCECLFPPDALPGSTVRSSIRNWRKERINASSFPGIECSPRTTGWKYRFSHEYDILPLCVFCNQFFTKCARIDTDEQGHPLQLSPVRRAVQDNDEADQLSTRTQRADKGVLAAGERENVVKMAAKGPTSHRTDIWKFMPEQEGLGRKCRQPVREKHVEGSIFPSRPYSSKNRSCARQVETCSREGEKCAGTRKKKQRKKKMVNKKKRTKKAHRGKGAATLPKPKWAVEEDKGQDGRRRAKRPQILFHACLALQVRKKVEHLRMLECKQKMRHPVVLKDMDT